MDLDVCIYSFFELRGINIPLKVHVNKIKNAEKYQLPDFDVVKIDTENNVVDKTNIFFYGKFQKLFHYKKMAEEIYEFIDYENMNFVDYLLWFPRDKENFVDFILNSEMCTVFELHNIYHEIIVLIKMVKEQFLKKLFDLVEIEKKYPEIKLVKNEFTDTKTYKKYKDDMYMNTNMSVLNCFLEHNGEIFFEENIGKAANEYSWREYELRKIYKQKKQLFENFNESVKNKVMEEMSPTTENS